MPTGQFSGYTGDTLVHLANGGRKYMHDLASGDELLAYGSSTGAVVRHVIRFEYDGFIALVAAGIATTRYTLYRDLTTGADTTPIIAGCRTIYYHGPIYNFSCRNTNTQSPDTNSNPEQTEHVFVTGSNPAVSQIGTFEISKNTSDEIIKAIMTEDTNYSSEPRIINLAGVWSDPPGLVTQRHPRTATV